MKGILMEQQLAGKVAIITGAGNGIGKAGALLFAQQGARVAIVDRDERGGKHTVAAIGDGGSEALFFASNVANETAVREMVVAVLAAWGHIDILYNNAGVLHPADTDIIETSLDTWNEVLAVNLTSAFLCTKYVLPHMLARRSGSVIMTSSVAALDGFTLPHVQIAYTASKGALLALTHDLAVAYGEYNVRFNALCAGAIETDLTRAFLTHPHDRAMRLAPIPLGRFGRPEEVAQAALFLASDASTYCTGQVLVVDGGVTKKCGYDRRWEEDDA